MNYVKLTDEQLDKLNGKRLLALKRKMNKVVGQIEFRINDNEELKDELKDAKSYKESIIERLEGLGNIEK